MEQKVIIIGGIGSGTVIAQAINEANSRGDRTLVVYGFMSHDKEVGEDIEGIPVVVKQSAENILKYYNEGYKYIFALHRMDGGEYFINLYNSLGLKPEMMATFIHPTAYVAPNVKVMNGCVIMQYSMISAGTTIGCNTLIMGGATVGHNTNLGEFNHIASQAVVGSHIETAVGVHFGLNCTVREYLKIGEYSTIGMGAVQTKDVGAHEMWAGVPAKLLRKAK
ncbi:MAG: hypothetical protein IJZ22_08785 [Bacteroidaceae bacterium]|nr:hypothetical protein [Bacteroidaceae bacterium]